MGGNFLSLVLRYQCQPWWRHKSKTSPCCNRSAMRNWEFRPIGCWSVGCAGNSERLVREIADGLQFVRKLHFPLSFSSFSPEWLSNHLNTTLLRLFTWPSVRLTTLVSDQPCNLKPNRPCHAQCFSWADSATNLVLISKFYQYLNFKCQSASCLNWIKTGAHLHNTLLTKFSSKATWVT